MKKKKVIVVVGPTASGKSKLAHEIAKKYGGFLVSADSRQVYRGMDIGTNKDRGVTKLPTYALRATAGRRKITKRYENKVTLTTENRNIESQITNHKSVLSQIINYLLRFTNYVLRIANLESRITNKHFLIVNGVEEYMVNVVKPNKKFNLDDWLRESKKIIRNDDRLAVVVGGTMLYTSALVDGYELQGGFDKLYRRVLEKQLEADGLPSLVKRLIEIDPDADKKIDLNNSRRVIRALEWHKHGGKIKNNQQIEPEFEFLVLGKSLPREELYFKIDNRVREMIDEGLVDEVKFLIKKGYEKNSPAMTGIGYRQIVDFLEGKYDLNEAVRLIQRDTRHYAKQQLTWYRRDGTIRWISSFDEARGFIDEFLTSRSGEHHGQVNHDRRGKS
ncbi:TPA: tRNA (adenosine(37)-N6)-dimethylallyltransferase MiaA [Candidatus Falkowbacteria bacterium]|nr:tRNA (adenosine(37)-N6)-dimethylallyltransferase MiaA [Candidatus Falkowbacteria bacterium]